MEYIILTTKYKPSPISMVLGFNKEAILEIDNTKIKLNLGKTKLIYAQSNREKLEVHFIENESMSFDPDVLNEKEAIQKLFKATRN